MKQSKIGDAVLNPETRSHFITSCSVGGLDEEARCNIILIIPPSDNAADPVSEAPRSGSETPQGGRVAATLLFKVPLTLQAGNYTFSFLNFHSAT